jgi:enediyne biosynthesis protein E7
MAEPPGPKGEIAGGLNYAAWRADAFGFLASLAERHGDIVGFDLGHSPCILVNGAAEVRELLVEKEPHLRKPEFVKDSNRGHWGDGLTTLEGEDWQARRQILRQSFTARQLSSRLAIAAECAADMLDAWAPESESDLLREFRILTARIAARVVLDADLEGFPVDRRSGALSFIEAYGEPFTSHHGGDSTAPLAMTRPRAPKRMDGAIRIVAERIASKEKRADVLTDLIHARLPDGGRLSQEDIQGEVIQMLYAGHLTIPSTLLNFWRDIVANGLVESLAAEARVLCAAGAPEPTSLSRSFCVAALKESMRLHPPAPVLYREVARSFDLAGFEFARDAAVWASPQLLHHDPRYFPKPLRFRPERFRDGLAGASAWAYLPFGAGPRTCVSNQLALHQMTLIALMTAQRFDLTPTLFGLAGSPVPAPEQQPSSLSGRRR